MLTVVGTLAFDTLARVQRLAAPEETAGVAEVHADLFGGTGGNVAMALARLGGRTRLVSAVGPDFLGTAYEQALTEAGVDLAMVERQPEPTSRYYVSFEGRGGQMTYFFPGASRLLSAAGRALDGRVHLAAGEISQYPAFVEKARWVSFDPGQEVFHRDLRHIVDVLPHVDVLFINRHERRLLEERAGLDVARLLREGMEAVVETKGGDGAVVHTRDGDVEAPAVPCEPVDPTGAGDAHRAGYLFALEKGADHARAARFASVMGAFAIETVGPQASLPSLREAVARYADNFGEAPF